jgi:RNA polymerase-binding transcription factor DksA
MDPGRASLRRSQIAALRAAIDDERGRAVGRVEALERGLADIVASSELSPPDDEHDPEGATIAFERAQVSALLEQARDHVADLDRAEAAIGAGTYGTCASCGRAIGFERLLARPASATCVTCAGLSRA